MSKKRVDKFKVNEPFIGPVCPHLRREEITHAVHEMALAALQRRAESAAIICKALSEDPRNALSDIASARAQLDECHRFASAVNYLRVSAREKAEAAS